MAGVWCDFKPTTQVDSQTKWFSLMYQRPPGADSAFTSLRWPKIIIKHRGLMSVLSNVGHIVLQWQHRRGQRTFRHCRPRADT